MNALVLTSPAHADELPPVGGPTLVSGNPMCEDYDLVEVTRFDPIPGEVGDVITQDGVTVTVTDAKDGDEVLAFDWTSTTWISAVIVKAGSGANVYVYDPSAMSGSAVTVATHGVSHVSFCLGEAPPQDEEVTPEDPTFTDPTCDVLEFGLVVPDDTDAYTYDVTGTPGAGETVTVTATATDGHTFPGGDTASWEHTYAPLPDDCEQPEPPTISLVKVFLDEDGTWLSLDEPPAVLVELFDGSSTDTTALLTVTAESLYAGPAVLGESTYTVTEAPIDGWTETACTDEVLTEFRTSATGTGEFAAPQDDTTHVVCNAPEDTPPPPVVSPTAAAVVECDTPYVVLDNTESTEAVEFTITGAEDGTVRDVAAADPIVVTVPAGETRTVDIVLVEDAAYAITISAEGMETVTREGTWDCEQTEVEPDVTVRPEVTFAEPTCDDQDAAAVNAVDVDGVAYGLTGEVAPGGTVMVTATAADGYTLAEDAPTAWTHTFDDLADCEDDEVDVEPEATEKPQPAPQPAPAQELAATGFDSTEMLLLALLLMGLGAAALLAPAPRRER